MCGVNVYLTQEPNGERTRKKLSSSAKKKKSVRKFGPLYGVKDRRGWTIALPL